MIESEISLLIPLMGNWYLPQWFLHAHCLPITNPNVTDGTVCPITDGTKKLIRDAQDFTSSSIYSQTFPYLLVTKQAYINLIRIGHHLCWTKRELQECYFHIPCYTLFDSYYCFLNTNTYWIICLLFIYLFLFFFYNFSLFLFLFCILYFLCVFCQLIYFTFLHDINHNILPWSVKRSAFKSTTKYTP